VLPRCHALVLLLVCSLLLLPVVLEAAESDRKGFVLGFGLGHGLTNLTTDDLFIDGSDVRSFGSQAMHLGVATNLKLGYAPTSRWLLHWSALTNWFTESRYSASGSERLTMMSGVAGIGATYYARANGPSPLVTIGAGYANLAEFSKSTAENNLGLGLWGGVGYEFTRHWEADVTYTWGSSKAEDELDEGFRLARVIWKRPFGVAMTLSFVTQ